MQVFTSDHALKLDWLPKWVAIIGSGYIGLEFSDVYTALGSEVTFVEVNPPAPPPLTSSLSLPGAVEGLPLQSFSLATDPRQQPL